VSRHDASTGWSFWATAGSTARVASMLPETAVAEVFAPGRPAPLIAFQERAFSNVAVPEGGGLRLSGSWPFGTGVTHADWVVAVAAVGPGVRPRRCPDGDLLAAVVPISQFERSGVWDASGLSGTGTYGYTIEDVVVSWDRVWAYPPGPPLRGGAHFCFRRAPIKHTGFALGVAASSLTLFVDHLAARVGTTREPSAAVTTDVARCSLRLAAARALAFETVGGVWADVRSLEGVSPASQGRLRAVARYVTEVAVDVCAVVMRHGDASLLARQNPLQRNLRDITAAAAHAEVNHAALEELGMSLLADGAPAAAAGWWSA
jgi:alkylation response protein AidB-like acyl-CoA dehydrogenase